MRGFCKPHHQIQVTFFKIYNGLLPKGNTAKDMNRQFTEEKDLVKMQKKKKSQAYLTQEKMHNLRGYHVIAIRLMTTTENYCLIMLSVSEDTER